MPTPTWEWVGQLGGVAFVCLVAFSLAVWKIFNRLWLHFLGDDTQNNTGRLGAWEAERREFHASIVKRLEAQQLACSLHVNEFQSLNTLVRDQRSIGQAAVETGHTGNAHLLHLIQIHEASLVGAKEAKQAAIVAFEMWRDFTAKEFPNSAAEVSRHCDLIKKIIGEA